MSEPVTYQLVGLDGDGREVERFAVQALPLRPQDVLVVRPPEGYYLTSEQAQQVKAALEERLPGQRVLVFIERVDLLRLEMVSDGAEADPAR